MDYLAQQLFNAVTLAGLYSLVALGVTLTFGLTRLVNFAHGEVLMIGGYTTYAAMAAGASYAPAVLLAGGLTLALGLGLERFLFRPTLSQPMNGFIVSLGLIIAMQNVVVMIFGTEPQIIASPFASVWALGNLRISSSRLAVLATAVVLLAAYFAFTRWSKWGRAVRACNEDREAAALLGIPTRAIIMWTFAAGSALAGIGGALLALILPVTVNEGGLVIVKAFSIALVGGLGSPNGVVVGALILAVLETFLPGTVMPVEWAPVVPFALIVLTLMLRPHGLFRGSEGSPVS